MFKALEPYFKENNVSLKHQKSIVFYLEQYNRDNTKQTFKDYCEVLIKNRVFSKIKKDQIDNCANETFTGLIILIFPDWDIKQLEFEVKVDDINKTVKIVEKNELANRLFNTIINF